PATPPSAARRSRAPRPSTRSTPAWATSRRTASAAGSCSSSRSPRTSPCTTTTSRPQRSSAGCDRGCWSSARSACYGPSTGEAGALSGGNQQKVVLAREIERDPKVLIAAQPTRGLDVGAIEFVHTRLVEERDEGRAILLVSLELDEILSLSDRIFVIYEGRFVGGVPPTTTEQELGIAMTGGRAREAVA